MTHAADLEQDEDSPKDIGRQLRDVRRKQGLSRSEVARSAGLTRRELAAYERGKHSVPESDLWCLAGSCGVDVSELLPERAPVQVNSDLSLLAVGDSIRYLRSPVEDDELLRQYLSMIYELRNLAPGTAVPLREHDLVALADALGGSPERIEARLVELVGMSQQEAARLRAMIMPPRSLGSGPAPEPAPPAPPPESGVRPSDVFHALSTPESAPLDDNLEVVDFFSAPRASDPFDEPPAPVGASPEPEPEPEVGATAYQAPEDDLLAPLRVEFAPDDEPPSASVPTIAPPIAAPPPATAPIAAPPPMAWSSEDFAVEPPAAPPVWSAVEPEPEMPDRVEPVTPLSIVDPFGDDDARLATATSMADADDAIAWTPDDHDQALAALLADVRPEFERAGSNWQVGGIFPATATADDGALALRRADARWALADLQATADFTIEASIDFAAGAGFGVLFRASVDDSERVSGYSFDIDPIASGGGYLVRQWVDNRQHWRPIAHAPITDPALLYGRHSISLTVRSDQLTVLVDNDTVLTVPALSRSSLDVGREPCRGDRIGIQAWATTEVTVDSFRVARY